MIALLMMSSLSVNSQDLQTYSGPISPLGKEGTATYQYRNAPDGSRIFEGEFLYVREGANPLKVSGVFKNDKQVGKWVFERFYEEGSSKNEKTEIIFTNTGCELVHKFSIAAKGHINATISWTPKIRVHNPKEVLRRSEICSQMFVRSINFFDSRNGKLVRGKSDEKGRAIGEWRVQQDAWSPSYTREFTLDHFGYHTDTKWYYTEKSTGDKKYDQTGKAGSLMNDIITNTKYMVYACCLRSTLPLVILYVE